MPANSMGGSYHHHPSRSPDSHALQAVYSQCSVAYTAINLSRCSTDHYFHAYRRVPNSLETWRRLCGIHHIRSGGIVSGILFAQYDPRNLREADRQGLSQLYCCTRLGVCRFRGHIINIIFRMNNGSNKALLGTAHKVRCPQNADVGWIKI